MLRFALKTYPRACFAVGSAGTAGCAQFVSYGKNTHTSCEPRPLLETITGFFGGGKNKSTEAVESFAPLVFVGPSGVGKGTLIAVLMKEYPEHFGFCVSTTTRAPRPGEVDGVHYHFSEKAPMQKAIQDGKFLESAEVHTNYYGTSIAALEAVQSSHKIAILDIDVQGAKNVKAKIPREVQEAKFFFLSPPCMEVLEARLRGRGTETEQKIQVRLKNANGELEFSKTEGFFDCVIVADDGFKEALPRMKAWLESVYPQLKQARQK